MFKFKCQINYKFLARFILVFFILSSFFLIWQNSAWAVWQGMDRTVSSENLSNSSEDSDVAQMALDTFGNPFVVWSDETTGNGDIYFKKWDSVSGSWTKMDGTAGFDNLSANSGASINPQIKLDSLNMPYVVWVDATTNMDIYFTKWTPSTGDWTSMDGVTLGYDNLSDNAGDSEEPQIELDSANNPYVVWRDLTLGGADIYFTKWTPVANAWTKMNGTAGYENISNSGLAGYPLLQIDPDNYPYIVWEDATTGGGDIYLTRWKIGTSDWVKMDGTAGYDNISNNSGASLPTQMLLNDGNNPNIVWFDLTPGNQEVYFSKWTPVANAWTKMDGTAGFDNLSNSSGTSHATGLQFDSSNNPYVVWDDTTTGTVDIYFSKWTPAADAWTKMDGTAGYDNVSNNAGTSRESQLQLGSSNNPYVAWMDMTGSGNYEVFFSKWTPAADAWTKMDGTIGYDNISNNSNPSLISKILLNNVNYPYIVWVDNATGNYEIYFTRWVQEINGQINISASVDPSLTLSLSSTTCGLGTFDSTKVNTCQYNTTVTTNASSGYTAYIRDDGNLRNATNDINDAAGGTTAAGSEEYGVATSDTDTVDITAKETSGNCTILNGGSSDVNALALTISDQSYATEDAPVDSDLVTLCHSASISGTTPAGVYANVVTITIIANF
jgi:hypothetical protein